MTLTDLSKESDFLVEERLHIHQQDGGQSTLGQLCNSFLTVHTIPVAFGIVTSIVTVSIGIMFLAVCIVDRTETKCKVNWMFGGSCLNFSKSSNTTTVEIVPSHTVNVVIALTLNKLMYFYNDFTEIFSNQKNKY